MSSEGKKIIAALIREYLMYIKSLHGEEYSKTKARHLKKLLQYLNSCNVKTVDRVEKKVILKYVFQLRENYYVRSINQHLTVLRSFLDYLLESEYISKDLRPLIKNIRRQKKIYRIPSIQQIEKYLANIDIATDTEKRDRSILELIYSTGIRRNELLNLKLNEVDLEKKRLRITQGKGKKDRIVPIGDMSIKYLIIYLTEARRFFPDADKEQVVYLSSWGGMVSKSLLHNIFQKYNDKSDIYLHPHLLRHACATHMLQNGADIRYIQELLGHKTLASTEIYTHVMTADLHKTHNLYHPRSKLPTLEKSD